MKQVGGVEVPQEAFLAVLNLNEPGARTAVTRCRVVVTGVRHLYVHLPFCSSRCGYCDFVTVVGRAGEHGRYVDALLCELELERAAARAASSRRCYLGGGTPTFTEPRRRSSACSPACPRPRELTVEANPETVTPELAVAARAARASTASRSVPRASSHGYFGRARSCCLDRTTSGAPFYRLRDAGIDNISLDLIYGIPGQEPADLARDLAEALALEPEHISAYELEAKPGTRFTHAHGAELERQAEAMEGYFEAVVETLTGAGYRWYETANFCRGPDGRAGRDLRARHNLGYWLGRDYLGIGVGAVSTIESRRWRNAPSLAALHRLRSREASGRRASSRSCRRSVRATERVMLGLRLDEPLSLAGAPDA